MNIDLRDRNTQIGIGLVLVGMLALFGNLGWLAGAWQLIGLALFVAAGAVVLRMYTEDPSRIWSLPVGFGLVGLGLWSLGSSSAFLGAVGLGFLAVFLADRQRWWAIVPGGVLITVGLTLAYDELVPRGGAEPVFFFGLAATFAALYLLPSADQRWAVWPAGGLAVVAVLTIGFQGGWVLPVVLIGVGAWLLARGRGGGRTVDAGEATAGAGPEAPEAGPGPGDPGAGARAPGGPVAGGASRRDPTSPVGPAARTPAQTPGAAAVQPSQRPETPEQAAQRFAADAGEPPRHDADVPPYGQESAEWTREVVEEPAEAEEDTHPEQARRDRREDGGAEGGPG